MVCIVVTLLLGNSVYSQCNLGADCDKLIKTYIKNTNKERSISKKIVKSGKNRRVRLVKKLYKINEDSHTIYIQYANCRYGKLPYVHSTLIKDEEERYLFKKSLIKEIETIVKTQ